MADANGRKIHFHKTSVDITFSTESISDHQMLGGILPSTNEFSKVQSYLQKLNDSGNRPWITVKVNVGDLLDPVTRPVQSLLILGALIKRDLCDEKNCGHCRTNPKNDGLRYTSQLHECLRAVCAQIVEASGHAFIFGHDFLVSLNASGSIPLRQVQFSQRQSSDPTDEFYKALKSATRKHGGVVKRGDVINWELSWFWQEPVWMCIDRIERSNAFSCLTDHRLLSEQATTDGFDERYLKNCLILAQPENSKKDLYLRIHAETGSRALAIIDKVSKKMLGQFPTDLKRINLKLVHSGEKRLDIDQKLQLLELKEVIYKVSEVRMPTFGTTFSIDDAGQNPKRATSAILAIWIKSEDPSHYICFDCDTSGSPHQCFFEQAVKTFIDEFDKL